MMMLAQVTGPESNPFACGIVLRDDKVVKTAPMLGYMHGWTRDRVREYCERRNWTVKVVRSGDTTGC